MSILNVSLIALKTQPADLTRLAAKNGGKYPSKAHPGVPII
jgi:hypothetical protein